VKSRFQSLPFKCNLQRYNEVRGTSGDEVMVSVQAFADVITAPVESSSVTARRKTHEVLRDALATGLDAVGLDGHGGGGAPSSSSDDVRGGRGGGAVGLYTFNPIDP
jgi:hypothetical protein